MEHRDLTAEGAPEPAHRLRREGDLRHQKDGAFSPLQRRLDETDIHLGLAAAGDAPKEGGLRLSRGHEGHEPRRGLFLLGREDQLRRCDRGRGGGRLTFRQSAGFQDPLLHQSPHQGRGSPRAVADLLFRENARFQNAVQNGLPGGAIALAQHFPGLVRPVGAGEQDDVPL